MTWLAAGPAVLALLLLLLFLGAWWGSEILFHPPKMLPMEIWPDRFGLAFETAEFKTSDGLVLKAWLIPAAGPTDRTVMVLHGWGDNKGDVLQHARFLHEGFNLFLFDFRHHGESQGDRTSIGTLEVMDTEAAIEFLKAARPRWHGRLGAFGLSMGASLAIWAAAARPEVRAVAAEAPFPSFNGVVGQWTYNSFRLPYYPFAWLTLAVIRWRLGRDPEPASPAYHVGRISPRPILFVSGEEDALMPLAAVRSLYDLAGEPKELWVVPGAGHGKCEEVGGDGYHRRLSGFFDRNL